MARLIRRVAPPLLVLAAALGLGSLKEGPIQQKANACELAPPASAVLGVTRIVQEQRMWCWAAVGQMTMKAVKPDTTVSQCDQVSHRLTAVFKNSPPDCCKSLNTQCKIAPGAPDFAHYGFAFVRTGTAQHPQPHLEWDEIRREIGCGKRPFAFGWRHQGGNGHMLLAVGYETVGGQRFVIAINPRSTATAEDAGDDVGDQNEERLRYTYEAYRDGTSFDKHETDYFGVRFTGAG